MSIRTRERGSGSVAGADTKWGRGVKRKGLAGTKWDEKKPDFVFPLGCFFGRRILTFGGKGAVG